MSGDLLPSFRFVVTLDAADAYLPASQARLLPKVAAGAFQTVSGLGADLELMPYAEGGQNDFIHQLPVRHSWTRIVLKHGIVRDATLWQWYQVGLSQSLGARRDGSIILLDRAGERAMAWEFRGGLASKWQGPALDAMQGGVLIESLEIAHHGLTLAGGALSVGAVIDAIAGVFA